MLTMGHSRILALCLIGLCMKVNSYEHLESKDRVNDKYEFGENSAAVQAASRVTNSFTASNNFGSLTSSLQISQARSMLGVNAVNQGALPPVPNVPGGSTRNPEARLIYRTIVLNQNGTAMILSANKSMNPSLPWGATAFSYGADLSCGASSTVGSCYLAGSITHMLKNDPTTAQALMDGQCELNSKAASCDKKLKGGARLLLRGLAAIKFHPENSVPENEAIEGVYADRLFVRDILYNAGPDTVVGALTSLTSSALGFKRGVVKLNALKRAPSTSVLPGAMVFNLSI